jgi:hypothetical protein
MWASRFAHKKNSSTLKSAAVFFVARVGLFAVRYRSYLRAPLVRLVLPPVGRQPLLSLSLKMQYFA